MSVNVKTENVNDATIQVHIAFETAKPYQGKKNKRRATRKFNNAGVRTEKDRNIRTGRNKATHRSTTKNLRRNGKLIEDHQQKMRKLPAPPRLRPT